MYSYRNLHLAAALLTWRLQEESDNFAYRRQYQTFKQALLAQHRSLYIPELKRLQQRVQAAMVEIIEKNNGRLSKLQTRTLSDHFYVLECIDAVKHEQAKRIAKDKRHAKIQLIKQTDTQQQAKMQLKISGSPKKFDARLILPVFQGGEDRIGNNLSGTTGYCEARFHVWATNLLLGQPVFGFVRDRNNPFPIKPMNPNSFYQQTSHPNIVVPITAEMTYAQRNQSKQYNRTFLKVYQPKRSLVEEQFTWRHYFDKKITERFPEEILELIQEKPGKIFGISLQRKTSVHRIGLVYHENGYVDFYDDNTGWYEVTVKDFPKWFKVQCQQSKSNRLKQGGNYSIREFTIQSQPDLTVKAPVHPKVASNKQVNINKTSTQIYHDTEFTYQQIIPKDIAVTRKNVSSQYLITRDNLGRRKLRTTQNNFLLGSDMLRARVYYDAEFMYKKIVHANAVMTKKNVTSQCQISSDDLKSKPLFGIEGHALRQILQVVQIKSLESLTKEQQIVLCRASPDVLLKVILLSDLVVTTQRKLINRFLVKRGNSRWARFKHQCQRIRLHLNHDEIRKFIFVEFSIILCGALLVWFFYFLLVLLPITFFNKVYLITLILIGSYTVIVGLCIIMGYLSGWCYDRFLSGVDPTRHPDWLQFDFLVPNDWYRTLMAGTLIAGIALTLLAIAVITVTALMSHGIGLTFFSQLHLLMPTQAIIHFFHGVVSTYLISSVGASVGFVSLIFSSIFLINAKATPAIRNSYDLIPSILTSEGGTSQENSPVTPQANKPISFSERLSCRESVNLDTLVTPHERILPDEAAKMASPTGFEPVLLP